MFLVKKGSISNVSSIPMYKNLFILVCIIACGQMAQTIFVPALPMIATSFHVNNSNLQAIMACYLLSYGLLQFIYGPVSDKIGRKKPLQFGLGIFIFGAILAICSSSFKMLLIASVIQGCGTAAGGVLFRSVPRDYYNGEKLVKFNSYISMAIIFSPLLAPFLGSLTSQRFGWHATYGVLVAIGMIVLAIVHFKMEESLPEEKRVPKPIWKSYKTVFSHKPFRGYLLSLIAMFSGIAAFEAVAGTLYGQFLKLSPMLVSIYFVLPVPGYLVGALYTSKQPDTKKLLKQGIYILGIGALFMLIPGVFGSVIGWTLLIGSALFFAGTGMLCPAITSMALDPFPEYAGIAGALLGGLQNFGSGLAALALALSPLHGQLSIGLLSVVMVLVIIHSLMYARRSKKHLQLTNK